MPSATDEDRAWAEAEFGSIDPGAIIAYLESCGYRQITEKKNYGCWYGPGRPETEKETRCLDFLCAEWDFGGVIEEETPLGAYRCSGTTYHLPTCGGSCGEEEESA